ncbi:MAG TPA: aminotransferase class III-fold pyridoxal phosphate-dependent enzyme, partial [Pyrinomonadaceae bacterium]
MSQRTKARSASPAESVGDTSTLVELLRRRAGEQPERLAYTFLTDGGTEELRVTYGELDERARSVGAWLQSSGAVGERVLLLYPPGLDYVYAFFGCLYAGAVAVPAYPPRLNHSLRRLQSILDDAGAKFALTTSPILARVPAFAEQAPGLQTARWLATDQLEMTGGAAEAWEHPRVGRETLAFLQYTSGSTSTPKGVMVTHGNVLYNSAYINYGNGHTPQNVSLSWLPHFHDMGLICGIIQPLYSGFHSLLMSPVAFLQRPLRWLEAVTRHGVTHTGGPNFAYDLCVRRIDPEQRGGLDLSSWGMAYNGAEPVRRETLERFAEFFAACGFRREAFSPAYGLAEATLKVSIAAGPNPPVFLDVYAEALAQNRVVEAPAGAPGKRELVGSGQPDFGTQVRIVNPDTAAEVESDSVGEIWVSGPGVAGGYWGRAQETEQTFNARMDKDGETRFLRTGDLGFLKNGELFVTGRLKDLIIINGHNHYPQDIEWTVEQCHPAVLAGCCAAFSVEERGAERLVVVAEIARPSAGRDADFPNLFDAIRRAVAEQHELEVEKVLLLKKGSIPKTSSGKIQRYACREGFLNATLKVWAEWPAAPHERAQPAASPPELAGKRARPATEPQTHRQDAADDIQTWLVNKLAETLRVEPREIDAQQPFASFGIGSVQSVSLSGELADWLGRPLPPTLLYDYPTIAALTGFLAGEQQKPRPAEQPDGSAHADSARPTEPIAIIGIGCRFPGAESPEAFWNLLRAGRDAITECSPDPWRTGAGAAGAAHARCGLLPRVEQFDAHFFSISPREALHIDPQQRLLLEVAWEALEAAGQSPARLAGTQTGVFIGISGSDYQLLQQRSSATDGTYFATGNSHSIAANRLSYLLDLRGPSVAIDTACSSSLVAVHLACQSLLRGESSLALAGGVNLILNPNLTDGLARAGMLSADGLCKVFDADANGYVRAEGCGVVVLKRLSDALRDGDDIIAQIKATATNQDGRSNGLTAPNGLAQQAVIRRALDGAGVAPSEIDFVETHGSGTPLGDPIEVNSLISVLSEGRAPEQVCALGSVKANIGHLEAAAGVAGLIKTALTLRHAEIPPQIHLKNLNPHLAVGDTPFSVPTRLRPWPESSHRRLAGVSSFGFGGTNAHAVLEEAPALSPALVENERPLHLLTLSARSESSLKELARRYETFLGEHPEASLPDVCFTANTGRTHFRHRLALVCDSSDGCLQQLRAFVSGREVEGMYSGRAPARERPDAAGDGADAALLVPEGGDWSATLSAFARCYVAGVDVDLDKLDENYRRRRVTLPTYPFERRKYWIDEPEDSISGDGMPDIRQPSDGEEDLSKTAPANAGMPEQRAASPIAETAHPLESNEEGRRQEVLQKLCGIVAELLHMRADEVDPHAPFLEMGADSIVLVSAVRTIENSFGIKISIRQLFDDLSTIDALASHITRHAAPATVNRLELGSEPEPVVTSPKTEALESTWTAAEVARSFERPPAVSESEVERIVSMQLAAFSRLTAQQLESLRYGGAGATRREEEFDNGRVAGRSAALVTESKRDPEANPGLKTSTPYVPYRKITPGANGGLSARQAKHLESLIARYTKRTPQSKRLAQASRHVLADSRASVGFRLSIKEMLYPITGAHSAGSKIWDVDGNEYVDVTMGFGVHLFGHDAPFIRQALEEQLKSGIQLGPRSERVGEVAALLCELTGHERVAFCNSGTEAVMTALRLARAATGRTRVAIFSGSYHGHSDGTLAIAEHSDGQLTSLPMAPGVPKKVAEDVVVLEYGTRQSLDYLKLHATELACVLVEPVQSRNPALQPRAFLEELREITTAAGAALVFDEMVTGFRVHPGGAQGLFGVKADIATYGKIIGGGMPVGVVAGRASFLDGIDGGAWQYADASYPTAETTFFGGTFCMHPLTMAAALATLRHLKHEGPALQQRLNERTSRLVAELNAHFTAHGYPLGMANFGSLFRFVHTANMDLFYYHLMEKGVYIWEWRSGFLSTAHTEEDFRHFERAIKESLAEMREGGFLPERSAPDPANTPHPNGNDEPAPRDAPQELAEGSDGSGWSPLSDAQEQLWLLSEFGEEASLAYHESVIIELNGTLDIEHMRAAWAATIDRHEALRTAVDGAEGRQRVLAAVDFALPLVDFTGEVSSGREAAVDEWLRREWRRPFDLRRPPLLRVALLKVDESRHLLVLIAHHIIIDSWSLSLLVSEVAAVYSAAREQKPRPLPRALQFGEYLRELSRPRYVGQLQQAETYWREQFSAPAAPLSLANARPPVKTYQGSKVSLRIEAALTDRLKAFSRQRGCTLFMSLFACYAALLHRLTGQDEVVVGIPVSGRYVEGSEHLVGYCTHLLPVRSRGAQAASFNEYLRSNRNLLLGAYEHQVYTFAKLLALLNPAHDLSRTPIIQTTFNLEPNAAVPEFAGLDAALFSSPVYYTKFDLGVNVVETNGELLIDLDYNTDLFEADSARRIGEHFRTLLEAALTRPDERLAALPLMTEDERRRLLEELNDTREPLPDVASFHELFEEQARLTPDATAVVCKGTQLTYRELNCRANQLAHYLKGCGIGSESRVGICVERSAEMLIGLLGILKAGCAYVPLDPEYPRERLLYMLRDAGASVLLTQQRHAGLFPPELTRVLELDTLLPALALESEDDPAPPASADMLAYVIYTSGSTGRPKGVQVTHASLVNLLTSMQRLPGLSANDTLLAVTTISFDIAAL